MKTIGSFKDKNLGIWGKKLSDMALNAAQSLPGVGGIVKTFRKDIDKYVDGAIKKAQEETTKMLHKGADWAER